MEEDEDKTERAQFPKVLSEYTSFIGKDKSIHAWMAELLWDCRDEEPNRRTQSMAVPQNTNVYLEAMEATENQEEKSNKTWNTRILCTSSGKQSKKALVCVGNGCGQQGINKTKTDKQWLL